VRGFSEGKSNVPKLQRPLVDFPFFREAYKAKALAFVFLEIIVPIALFLSSLRLPKKQYCPQIM